MKNILVSISAIAILAISGNALFARGDMGMQGGNGIMQKELNLTTEQQDKIFKISQDFRQKAYDNRNDTVKVAEIRVERLKAIIAVLTPEQKEKFNTLHQNRQDKPNRNKHNCW
jgi:Spy/CpxP family protein refolding chaperone